MTKKLLLLFAVLFTAFTIHAQVNTVALVGEAAGGWPSEPGNPGPIDIHQMSSSDGVNWTLNGVVITTAISGGNGGVKFRANNDWAINWGASNFPTGTGTQNGANILTIAGTYDVTFNSNTGEYNFSGTSITYPVISLVGDAAAGWTTDIPMTTTDGIIYKLDSYTFISGHVKFRQDNGWTVNWGSNTFPTGTGIQDGADIPVTPGTYNVTLNINTGDYTFLYPTISLIGSAGIDWNTDLDMQTSDGIAYTLTFPQGFTIGEAKFRKDHSWTINWGSSAFPSGTGTQDGSNIQITATGYNYVILDRITGNYTFSNILSNSNFDTKNDLTYFPNPSNDNWNIISSDVINSVELITILGKTVLKINPQSQNCSIDGTSLSNGIYFAKITTSSQIQTIKLIKN